MVKHKGLSLLAALFFLAFTLCFFTLPTYAASNEVYLSAWAEKETLYIIATSPAGVDAVFINEERINYRVDDALILSLKEHTDKETLQIYAVDFDKNRSATQTIQNPYYQAPKSSTASSPKTSSSTASKNVSSQPTVTSTPAPAVTSTPITSSSPSEQDSSVSTPTDAVTSSSSSASNPFTPEGAGATLNNATENDGKEFFTITTPEGNIFYLVIDRQRGEHNVYFLNAVTETDLLDLTERSDTSSETSPPALAPSSEPTTSEPVEVEKTPSTEKKKGASNWILFLILILAMGGGIYYFKVLKPKSQAAEDFDDEDEDGYFEDEGDSFYPEESDFLDPTEMEPLNEEDDSYEE